MSAPSVSAMEENGASEEVEALKSIYIRELEVTNCESSTVPSCISINLHPATADNTNEQYVCLTLVISLSPNYPHELPEIVIRNPRGLSDEHLERIKGDLQMKASESKGSAMLFELIELAKEHLTVGNTPRCACAICLYSFSEQDVFTKTDCYHYFHSHCLSRYVEFMKEERVVAHPLAHDTPHEAKVLCPVCREPIEYNDSDVVEAPPPVLSEGVLSFEPDSELVQVQQRMAALFIKQKSKGGIIDVEAEKNKYLLEISMVPSDGTNAGVRNSRPLLQAGGRKKRLPRKLGDSGAEGLLQDDGQPSKKPLVKQEARENRQSYPNNRTERYPVSERGAGVVRRGRGGFHSSDGTGDRRQQIRTGRGGPRSKMDRNDDRIAASSPKSTSGEANAVKAVTPDCDPMGGQAETVETQHRESQDETIAQRQGARRGHSRGANASARSSYNYRGGRGGQKHAQDRTVGAEVGGGSVSEERSDSAGAEDEGPRQNTGRPRRPYGRRMEKRYDDEGASHAVTNQDPYRQRTNYRYRRGNSSGRWNYGRWRSLDESENRARDERAHSEGEKSFPSSEDLPVSHLMVLTGPPTKAFSNSYGGDAEANRPAAQPVRELPNRDSVQSLAASRDSARFCASLPPGFKSGSPCFASAPPPGFETVA